MARLVEKAGGWSRILRPGCLPQLNRHRLVPHERLVFRREFREEFPEPTPNASVSPDDVSIPVETECAIDITFEVLQHTAEQDHPLLRLFSAIPGVEKDFRRWHGGRCRPVRDLAPFGGELTAACSFTRIVEWTPDNPQVAKKSASYAVALDGIGEGFRRLADGDADIGGKVGGEDEGIEYGFGIVDAVSVAESVGTVDEIKITSRIGRLVAVRPPVLFRIPVRRVRVGPLCHLASPSSFPFLSNQRHFYPTSVTFFNRTA